MKLIKIQHQAIIIIKDKNLNKKKLVKIYLIIKINKIKALKERMNKKKDLKIATEGEKINERV